MMTAVRRPWVSASRIVAGAVTLGALLAAAEAVAQQPAAQPTAAPPAAAPAAAAAAPGGGSAAGAQIFNTVCVMCHDQTLITAQRKSRADWADTVEMMIGRGAPLTNEQAGQVVDYLAQNLGTGS